MSTRWNSGSLILQTPESAQMAHDLLRGFDMPEKYGRIARDAQTVGGLMHAQPLVGGNLSRANTVPDPCGKDLGPPARQGAQINATSALPSSKASTADRGIR